MCVCVCVFERLPKISALGDVDSYCGSAGGVPDCVAGARVMLLKRARKSRLENNLHTRVTETGLTRSQRAV